MRVNRSLFGLSTLLGILISNLAVSPYAEAATRYRVVHAFGRGKDGAGVFAGLALDAKGHLFGATTGGGAHNSGTVFELTSGTSGKWTEKILHSFCSLPHCSDGALPWDTPVLDARGNLYDDNSAGIFQMTPGPHGWSFTLIDGGSGGEGALPPENEPGIGDLLLDAVGNLYGGFGVGKNYNGAVAELAYGPHGWKEKNLYDFCLRPRNGRCLDGSYPAYRLTWDSAGDLFGVTIQGGAHKAGVAYELENTAGGWKEHVLHSFLAFQGDGYSPSAGLVVDPSGNVYGTTFAGGNGDNNGIVFELSRQQDGRWKETILYDFHNADQDGGSPRGGLVLDKAGNLYGTTTAGGDPNCLCGVVFKMTPGSDGKWTYQVLHRFTGTDGYDPEAGVILDDKGNLYGTTSEGGPGGYGVVFEITP